ncbi:Quinolinate phosphoribosyl transferase [Pseudothermotoga thermarum]|uniref:Quinolinate phosphoribosyl transferase n=1 Tax=Pseudothermotoga thermarum DSM 5069 TaxID=688269 RepID=F7YVM6_9THEM|nr:Quinolinate phosphoribosyl transferase [Pseudothermotoga thermarum]AEH51690.1 Quinolinate phosphoribosyl transferase [Pseudothermotoga thermarum DSM 5069]
MTNFTPEKAKELAKKLKKERDVIIEISGGINEENMVEYLSDDIDVISIGRLTSEIKYVDFSLEIF